MIQVKASKKGGFELTDRKRTVLLADKHLSLDEQSFNDPGEYEVDGIEVVYGTQAALIVWEKLQLVYVFDTDKPGQFEKAQFSPCDGVVFADNLESLEKAQINEILETYDPNVVVFSKDAGYFDSIASSYKFGEQDALKLTDQTLPTEGRDLIALI